MNYLGSDAIRYCVVLATSDSMTIVSVRPPIGRQEFQQLIKNIIAGPVRGVYVLWLLPSMPSPSDSAMFRSPILLVRYSPLMRGSEAIAIMRIKQIPVDDVDLLATLL